jgi:hypothetical protein
VTVHGHVCGRSIPFIELLFKTLGPAGTGWRTPHAALWPWLLPARAHAHRPSSARSTQSDRGEERRETQNLSTVEEAMVNGAAQLELLGDPGLAILHLDALVDRA